MGPVRGALDKRLRAVSDETFLHTLRLPVLLLPALISSFSPAEAAGFQVKTMRAPLSASQVERALVIGRGWLEFDIGGDYKSATGYWDENGKAQEFDGANWLYTTERLGLRYGIARRAELYWNFPFHYVNLSNTKLKTNTSSFGLGDLSFGYKYEWFRRDAPLTSVITDLKFRMPSGSEAPASTIGGPNTVTTMVLSTGQPDISLALRAKQQIGPLSVEGGVDYVHRFSAVTQFVVEVEEYQFQGRFKPGDEVRVNLQPTVQAGPVAIGVNALYGHRFLAMSGTTSAGIIPDANLKAIQGTDGGYLDLTPMVTLRLTRGFDIQASATLPLMGEDLAFWPLEEISPTRGNTYSATFQLRY